MIRVVLIGKVVIVTTVTEERFTMPTREEALEAYMEVASELCKASMLDPKSGIIS